jgi:short-subunit dehydrogenase
MVDDRVTLITGASSGIGEATARFLAVHGFPVVLVARRQDRLQAIVRDIRRAGGRADFLVGDLSQEETRTQIVKEAQLGLGPIQVLINNAGFGWYGYAESMPWTISQQMLDLNVVASTHLSQLFLTQFKEQGSGHIINVGSIAGNIPSQGVVLYSASKSFLEAYTTALHREMAGSRIKVSLLRLGAVKTPFYKVAQGISGGVRIPVEWLAVRPRTVAKALHRLILHPRRMLTLPSLLTAVPWLELCFGWLMDRLGPRLLQFQSRSGWGVEDSR